jgi:hypothetical protein
MGQSHFLKADSRSVIRHILPCLWNIRFITVSSGSYSEQDKFNQHTQISFPEDPSYYYPPVLHQGLPNSLLVPLSFD